MDGSPLVRVRAARPNGKRDPLEGLRIVDAPVAPRPEFADALEGRLRQALDVLLVPMLDIDKEGAMASVVSTQTIATGVLYGDVGRAIRWLTHILGLRVAKYWGPEDNPVFAYIVWHNGNSLSVSVRPPADNAWSAVGPASISLLEPDEEAIERIYERAIAAGADVVRELKRETNPAVPEGYLGFVLRDPEGNLWSVESVFGLPS